MLTSVRRVLRQGAVAWEDEDEDEDEGRRSRRTCRQECVHGWLVKLSRQLGTYQPLFQALLDFPEHTYEKISPSCSRSHEMEFTSMKADR